jgi:Holliday junction resolvasome RuvABC ATP-dependent DNA helicase subunit
MLETELEDIIGMDAIKKKLRSIALVLSVHYDHRGCSESAHTQSPPLKMDIVLQGNPGTGKTTIARLLSKIFFQLNLTSTSTPIL